MAVNFFGPVRLTMGLLPAMREQRFGHVVNIVTWGNQIKAPKFAAYIASKTALDVFGRIMGREAFFDNVTCTNVRVALVATDMIGPTEAYSDRRAESPEHCAERIVRALEDRPVTVNGFVGSVGRGLQPREPPAGRLRLRRDVASCARLGRRAWRVVGARGGRRARTVLAPGASGTVRLCPGHVSQEVARATRAAVPCHLRELCERATQVQDFRRLEPDVVRPRETG